VLNDKARNATDRLFRLLGLAYPFDDFVAIHRGLVGGRRDARESAMELVANVLTEPIRGAVIGLVDDIEDAERLAAAGQFRATVPVAYGEVLAELLASTSDSVRSVTVFHVGELGLAEFAGRIETMLKDELALHSESASDAARVLERIRLGGRLTPLPEVAS
jgi:hypothetical protein